MTLKLAQRGLNRLRAAWRVALVDPPPRSRNPALAAACDAVLAGKETGYKKAIVIQAAGKAADVALDAQSMQKGDSTPGSWDAREFAKKTFVLWNIDAGKPYSHSVDPYASNPYRTERFGTNPQKRPMRPAEYAAAARVLHLLQQATTPAIAFRNLVEVMLALRRYVAGRSVDYPLPNRASLPDTLACIDAFVRERSGGARLQAVVLALFATLQHGGLAYSGLQSRHVNAADAASLAAGDVAGRLADASVAIEVKDRPLDAAEMAGTIEKCRIAAVDEVLFVIRAPRLLAAGLSDATFEQQRAAQFSSGLNLYVEPFDRLCQSVLMLVGEAGRRVFLENVGTALATQNADVTHKWAWAALVKAL